MAWEAKNISCHSKLQQKQQKASTLHWHLGLTFHSEEQTAEQPGLWVTEVFVDIQSDGHKANED